MFFKFGRLDIGTVEPAEIALIPFVLILPPFRVYHSQGESNRKEASSFFHFSIDSSLVDLFILAMIRIVTAAYGLVRSYYKNKNSSDDDEEDEDIITTSRRSSSQHRDENFPLLELYHPNGTKKTREELEEEALEQPILKWLRHQHLSRPAIWMEMTCVVTCLWCILKCLLRMNVEIGLYADAKPTHPVMWVSIAFGSLLAVLESYMIEMTCRQVAKWGQEERDSALLRRINTRSNGGGDEVPTPTANNTTNNASNGAGVASIVRNPIRRIGRQVSNTLSNVSSSLSIPLLSSTDSIDGGTTTDGEYYDTTDDEMGTTDDEDSRISREEDENYIHPLTPPILLREMNNGGAGGDGSNRNNNDDSSNSESHAHGVSDIGSESGYKATWTDLISVCAPDAHLVALAFLFLLLAATAQVYIPKFTGRILDSLVHTFSNDPDASNGGYNDDDDNMIIHTDDDDAQSHKSMSDVPGFMLNVKLLIFASIMGGIFSGIRGSIFTVVRENHRAIEEWFCTFPILFMLFDGMYGHVKMVKGDSLVIFSKETAFSLASIGWRSCRGTTSNATHGFTACSR